MTKRKYVFSVASLKATGLPRDKWPLNNGVMAICIEKPALSKTELADQKSLVNQTEGNQSK